MFNNVQARGNSALLVGLDGATPILPREVHGRTMLTQIDWKIPCFGVFFGVAVSNFADEDGLSLLRHFSIYTEVS